MDLKYQLGIVALVFATGFTCGVMLHSGKSVKGAEAETASVEVAKKVSDELAKVHADYDTRIQDLQGQADASDVRVADLETKLAAAKAKVVQKPPTGPDLGTVPALPDTPGVIEYELVTAQKLEIAQLKGVNQAQAGKIKGLEGAIVDLQNECRLKEIAYQAQLAANKAGTWKGRFQGIAFGVGTDELISLLAHRR